MPLKQEPSFIVDDPSKYMLLIYADAGWGKTNFLSQIPDHYILAAEAGTSGVSFYGDAIIDWNCFVEKCKELTRAKLENFKGQRAIKTVCIDTADALFGLCANHLMKTTTFLEAGKAVKYEHVDDVLYGKGFKRAMDVMLQNLESLRKVGFGVVMAAHLKERTAKLQGEDVSKWGPNFSPATTETIMAACDAVGYGTTEEKILKEKGVFVRNEVGRFLYFQPTPLREAKHRLKGFESVGARIEIQIDGGWDAYVEKFKECYGKKIASTAGNASARNAASTATAGTGTGTT